MQKLKNTYIDQMIEAKLSSREIDFLLYIAVSQNDAGTVESVYYKDVCNNLSISVQTFYDIIHHLADLKLITYQKEHAADIRVTLLGNSFKNIKYEKGGPGYLNVAEQKFDSSTFRTLKAGSKLLFLYSQRFCNGKHMLLENFYETFSGLLGVVRKSIQLYIQELKEKKLLFVSKKRNKAYNYEIGMKRSTVLVKRGPRATELDYYMTNIKSLILRNFRKPALHSAPKAIEDVVKLVLAERAEKHDDFVSLIVRAIRSSIAQQKQEGKQEPIINAALVNKHLTDVIEQKFCKEYGIVF